MNPAIQGLYFFTRFARSFSRLGYEKRARKWPKQIFDFSGQHWLVTGASGGIGRAIVHQAAACGAQVTAAARSSGKLEQLTAESEFPERIKAAQADLSLMSGIDELAAWLGSVGTPVDVLVNNVGVLLNDYATTAEGMEASFATNLLNHYRLTETLVADDMLDPNATVINMSSGGMYNAPLAVDSLNPGPERYDGVMAYARHKRAQVELTRYWNEAYGDRGMRFYVMHPGWVDTQGVKTSLPGFRKLFKSVLRSHQQGADTALWLAMNRPACEPNEGIWLDRERQTEHVFSHTRNPAHTAQDLVNYLDSF